MFGKGQRNYVKPQGRRRKGKRSSKSLNSSQLEPQPLAHRVLTSRPISHPGLGTRRPLGQGWFFCFGVLVFFFLVFGFVLLFCFLILGSLCREGPELKGDQALTTGSELEF